jgi:serine/threonine-protein kinase RsbW
VEITMALSLPRDAASVPVTRQVLDGCLETLGVTPDTRADIALALSEACANVIRHAGPADEYEVTARTIDGRCIIEVHDHGNRGRAARLVPDPAGPLAEHGRGLQIIDAVVDDMSVTANGGTTLQFEKALDWLPGALAEQLFADHS